MAGEWQCDKCTLLNSKLLKKCEICGAPRRNVNSPDMTSRNATPQRREHENEKYSSPDIPQKFQASPSDANVVAHQSTTKAWRCPSCTFAENKPSQAKCEICGAHRPLHNVYKKCSFCDIHHHSTSSSLCYSCNKTRSILMKQNRPVSGSSKPKCELDCKYSKEVERIIQYCKANDTKFVDDSFPPTDRSICQSNPMALGSFKLCGNIQWLRPSAKGTYKIMDSPKPTDIEQGLLGNCWFLSALAVLVEKPCLLENIFISHNISKEGIYQLRLCSQGEWVDVFIDDLLPCDENGRLLFSRVKRNQLWVPLIEKALAKINGSYDALKAGRCIEGMSILTGAPCETLSFNSLDESFLDKKEKYNLLWAKLLSSKESGFLMGASCGMGKNYKGSADSCEKVGLVDQHAYSILDIKEFDKLRILKFHNPWGTLSWKRGCVDYSQDDLKKLGLFKNNESHHNGVFWMTFDDVLRYFQNVDICKHSYDWIDCRIACEMLNDLTSPISVIDIFNSSPQEVEIGLFLKEKRRRKDPNRIDLFVGIYKFHDTLPSAVGSLVESSPRHVGGFVGFNCFLHTGRYRIICASFSHLNSKISTKYCLTMHSSKPIEYNITYQPAHILAYSIMELCKSKGEYHQLHSDVHACLLKEGWGGFVVTVFNLSEKLAVHIRSDLSECFNVKSSRQSLITYDIIPPRHAMVVTLLSQIVKESVIVIKWSTSCGECPPGSNLSMFYHGLPPGSDGLNCPKIDSTLLSLHEPRFIIDY